MSLSRDTSTVGADVSCSGISALFTTFTDKDKVLLAPDAVSTVTLKIYSPTESGVYSYTFVSEESCFPFTST